MISLGWTVNLFQQGSASLSRIQEVQQTPPAIRNARTVDQSFMPQSGRVELRHVSFAYGDREVLHDINLVVPAGTSLGIVGPTGSGKSSLMNLIARVYDVTGGAVLVDGRDVRDISLPNLRKIIGYVPQESFLFSLSLRENVGFGVETLSDDQLEHALHVSQLAKDVTDFPRGVDTMVGERGVTLSGGQKQRTSIARAVARNPLILMLDEAFSSVDTNTEAAIMRELALVMRDRTSIVVAHRVSTVQHLDQIVVIRDGRITEQGTHMELLALNGTYTTLYRQQLIGEEMYDSESDGGMEATD
jgi:ATP-binding cassette subfamily B protein